MADKDIVELVISRAGGMRALGRALGINYQSIQSWKKIPAERVVEVEAITGIAAEQLRPDIFKKRPAPRKPK